MPLDQLYIDIGASTKTSAEQAVKLGAQVTFAGEGVAAFGNGYLTGKAMETRAACAMLAQLLCEDWEKDVDVVFTTSAQAMTSGGANAAFALHPDVAIVIGSIAADDGKGGKGTCKLGKGPATCLHDLTTYYDLDTYNQCIQIAEEKGLPLQQLENPNSKNESRQIQTAGDGVQVVALNIPCRYPSSISAMIQQQDLNDTAALLTACVEELA